jgi:putative SOS response-associated peptidase YedK
MCVRYTLHRPESALSTVAEALGVELEIPAGIAPRFNVGLASVPPVVASREGRPVIRGMAWGFVPPFSRGRPDSPILANARAETVATLPSFKPAVERRRCLVPANGFYEWRTEGRVKLPHVFMLAGGEPFAFAGIWEPSGEGNPDTFCILTTSPNELVAPIHDRMPVILTRETMPRWLGADPLPPLALKELTLPIQAGRMTVRPVNRHMSNSRNEGPKCLEPPDAPEPELPLGF